jgi:hypothetical protein
MSRDDRILSALATGRRLCDDCQSEVADVKPRQSVYQACSALRDQGLLTRLTESCEACNRMKIANARLLKRDGQGPRVFAAETAAPSDPKKPGPVQSVLVERPWYWEGNVQSNIVKFLQATGVSIQSQANTAAREQGKDIVAIDKDGAALWISVKGFPESSPNIQARHWFSGALLDLALYRGESDKPRLALGFPAGFTTYENLVKRTKATLGFLGCHVFWVSQNGAVTRESSPGVMPTWAD